MVRKQLSFMLLLLMCLLGVERASAQANRIVGTYQLVSDVTGEPSRVKIYKVGNTYEAQIIWLQHPNDANGNPKLDSKNPDAKLRSRKIVGTVIMKGLKYDADDQEWSGGRIYDPATGKSYKVVCSFESARVLKVRGYIGIPTLGRTVKWTKM